MSRMNSLQHFGDKSKNISVQSALESSRLAYMGKKLSNQISSEAISKYKSPELSERGSALSKVEASSQLLKVPLTARAPVIKKPIFPVVKQKRPLIKQSINVFDPQFPEQYELTPLEEESCANQHMRLFLHSTQKPLVEELFETKLKAPQLSRREAKVVDAFIDRIDPRKHKPANSCAKMSLDLQRMFIPLEKIKEHDRKMEKKLLIPLV